MVAVTHGTRNTPVIICANITHIQYSPTWRQELAPEVAARIAEAERIAAEAEAEAAAFAEQAAAVQAEHDLMRQEQLQASLPPSTPCCIIPTVSSQTLALDKMVFPAASCPHRRRNQMLYPAA